MSTIIDLTRPLTLFALSYPGDRRGIAADRSDGRATDRPFTQLERLDLHLGTHLDAPAHFVPGGLDVASVPLALRPAVVVRTRETAIPASALPAVPLEGRAVLFDTGWAASLESPAYFESFPHLTPELCEVLVARGAALVGIDTPSVDPRDPTSGYPAHQILLGAQIPIVEGLCGLDRLPDEPDASRFACFPLKLAGADGAPARAIAIVDL